VDYKKAFDSVWRVGLWKKIVECGIHGKILNTIVNMYKQIKSCIRVNNEYSDFFPSFKGLRQGENLSPLLFALFVNDLEEFLLSNGCQQLDFEDDIVNILRVMVLLYADDTVILTNSKQNAQKALIHLEQYCKQWKLEVNTDKTKVIVFGKRKINHNDIELEKKWKQNLNCR
jgi:phosphotransferase system HPr-like phosphotransfer protein